MPGALLLPRSSTAADVNWLAGTAFNKSLVEPISIYRDRATVREMLARLAEFRRTACLLDRRIDPSRNVSLKISQVPLREALEEVARQIDADVGTLGATVIVGPLPELDRMLTLAAVRKQELSADLKVSSARRVQLARGREIAWADLDRPVDVLDQIGRAWDLGIDGRELVPHDLWAGGVMADVDAVEALSIVVGQYDLTFRWTDPGRKLALIPAPSAAAIERSHRAIGVSQAEGIARIQQHCPGCLVVREGTTLSVIASVKQHEQIAELLGELPTRRVRPAAPVPLSHRRFPVRIVRKPLYAVLEALQSQGVPVEYDAAKLRAAGVDLEVLVSVEFENATAEELFSALCAPAGLEYDIDEQKVTLRPKSGPPSPIPAPNQDRAP